MRILLSSVLFLFLGQSPPLSSGMFCSWCPATRIKDQVGVYRGVYFPQGRGVGLAGMVRVDMEDYIDPVISPRGDVGSSPFKLKLGKERGKLKVEAYTEDIPLPFLTSESVPSVKSECRTRRFPWHPRRERTLSSSTNSDNPDCTSISSFDSLQEELHKPGRLPLAVQPPLLLVPSGAGLRIEAGDWVRMGKVLLRIEPSLQQKRVGGKSQVEVMRKTCGLEVESDRECSYCYVEASEEDPVVFPCQCKNPVHVQCLSRFLEVQHSKRPPPPARRFEMQVKEAGKCSVCKTDLVSHLKVKTGSTESLQPLDEAEAFLLTPPFMVATIYIRQGNEWVRDSSVGISMDYIREITIGSSPDANIKLRGELDVSPVHAILRIERSDGTFSIRSPMKPPAEPLLLQQGGLPRGEFGYTVDLERLAGVATFLTEGNDLLQVKTDACKKSSLMCLP